MQPTPTPLPLSADVRRHRSWSTPFHAALFIALLGFGACRDPKVAVYRVPKEPVAELPATKAVHGGDMASAGSPTMPEGHPATSGGAPVGAAPAAGLPGADTHGLQTASGPGLAWSAPASWEKKQGSMMRKATYAVTGEGGATADLAVSAFPGDVGGDVANVNRWRGQVGLPEVADAEALASIERLEANGLKIGVVDLVAAPKPDAAHLLGAIVPFDNATWFFKLVGPDAVVAKEKPAFVEFLKTIKPAAAPTP